jgi:mediator of RNA polymerase II transcription subunit 13
VRGEAKVLNLLEYWDGVEVTSAALDQCVTGKNRVVDGQMDVHAPIDLYRNGLHSWPFLYPKYKTSSQELMRAMRQLQPLLQEAIQKKKAGTARDATYQVSGPLTWRQFHRMAGRGTEDQCEPQPIPYVVVGHDKDWLTLSPLAVGCWENLVLEPYSRSRDVAYIVVAPDDAYVMPRVLQFFKELSCTYEVSIWAPINLCSIIFTNLNVISDCLNLGSMTKSDDTKSIVSPLFIHRGPF